MLTEVKHYLGPATVEEIVWDRLKIILQEKEFWAQLALASPYQPAKGDIVLVIGEEEYYVIGILLGRGKTSFQFPGELELRGDRVSIIGNDHIQLQSPKIQLMADRLETVAGKIHEQCMRAYRWIRESYQIRAGRMQTNVNGQHLVQAERLLQQGKKGVRINGPRIDLG